jgi:hypothetical protein
MLGLSTVSWFVMMAFFSLVREFDGLRFLCGHLFFAWSAALRKILIIIILGRSVNDLLLNCEVACALWILDLWLWRLVAGFRFW